MKIPTPDHALRWLTLFSSLGVLGSLVGCEAGKPADVCGDGEVTGEEVCDGAAFLNDQTCQTFGFVGGALYCEADCSAVTTAQCDDGTDGELAACGNGVLEAGEECDGGVPDHLADCERLGYDFGRLSCGSDCLFDTADCGHHDAGDDGDGGGSGSGDDGGGDGGSGDGSGGDSSGGSGDDGEPASPDDDNDGYSLDEGDCDDGDPNVHPGASEQCNGTDDDCDGRVDEDVTTQTWYRDGDGDGYGAGSGTEDCAAPSGHVARDGDCDDGDRSINPGASESCNDVDDDCDGRIDDGLSFTDYYTDGDGDGYGDGRATSSCAPVAGMVTDDGDCDDTDPSVNPDARESCNGEDDDCDGSTDEGLSFTNYYDDDDRDGYGDSYGRAESACSAPAGKVADDSDCDDSDSSIHPSATETCNDVDDDCDGSIDDGLTCYEAIDDTNWSSSAWCVGSNRDIFYASSSSLSLSSIQTDPQVSVTFYKCDGTTMSSNKSCHIRVGSWSGSSYSSSLARTNFTWSSGTSSKSVSFDGWVSASDFASDSCGSEKEFYIICEESSGDWNHWRSEEPVVIIKDCY